MKMEYQLTPNDTEKLAQLGLKPCFKGQWFAEYPKAIPHRVIAVDRGSVVVQGATQELRLNYADSDNPVAVGDWMMIENGQCAGTLDRSTWLRRRNIASSEAQLIAANIDYVFIVCAFATTEKLQRRNLNPRRIQRYLHAAGEGGATPIVVINKSDLTANPNRDAEELSKALGNVEVVTASAEQREVEALRSRVGGQDTVAFVGSSGVGKTSLINSLFGSTSLLTGDVRRVDNKGQHTTTRRQLILLPDGGSLIDTPGMRQFAVYSDETSQGSSFEEIEVLAERCRFADCRHESEPGCAVLASIASNELPGSQLDSYRTLQRELAHHSSRRDAASRQLHRKAAKQLASAVRAQQKRKRR